MIANLATPDNLFSIAIGFLFWQGLHYLALVSRLRYPRRIVDLDRRLTGYAKLKGCSELKCCREDDKISGQKEFEVLLGILKKIEAKNASTTTLLVFFLGVALASIVSTEETDRHDVLLSVACILLLAPTWHAFRGNRQIDQIDFESVMRSGSSDDTIKLREDLQEDLIWKELRFRFSRIWTAGTVIGLILLLSVDTIAVNFLKERGGSLPPFTIEDNL